MRKIFTGIIEEIGTVIRIERKASSLKVVINCNKVIKDLHLGDSMAVNGVCLTVASFNNGSFEADIMPETFIATALHKLFPGSRVNLERAMAAKGRFGGHFVSGHVDGTGLIIRKKKKENALYITIQVRESFLPYILEKGSIAIDGTSLTLFRIENREITISLIPHTQKDSVLAEKKIGEHVNIEFDMLAKYAQNIIKQPEKPHQNITMDLLADNGFI